MEHSLIDVVASDQPGNAIAERFVVGEGLSLIVLFLAIFFLECSARPGKSFARHSRKSRFHIGCFGGKCGKRNQ